MKPVVQQDKTGCGIACVAAVAGVSYARARRTAASIGIAAGDPRLYSETAQVRRLLNRFNIRASRHPTPFRSWEALPDLALLATKWRKEKGKPCWHWAVYVRDAGGACVLDSKRALRRHRRTDFGRIKPKWFIRLARGR